MKIERYQFGELQMDGRVYRNDFKIVAGQVVANWWRQKGHLLQVGDVTDVLERHPQLLIVGCGAHGLMRIDDELRQRLIEEGIELVALPTGAAVERFNSEVGRKDEICAAFHLTC